MTTTTQPRFPHLHWLGDGLLPLLLALVRACWLWPWLTLLRRTLTGEEQPLLPLPLIVALPVASLLLARLLRQSDAVDPGRARQTPRRDVPLSVRLAVTGGGLLALLLVLWGRYYAGAYWLWETAWLVQLGNGLIRWETGVPAAFLTLLAAAFLWLRGLQDAPKRLSHDDVWASFRVGLGAIVLYLLLVSLSSLSLSGVDRRLIVLFFALGMVALAVSNLSTVAGLDRALGGAGSTGSGRTPSVDRFWLLNTGLVVAGLLGAALLVNLLVAPQSLTVVFDALGAVLRFAWWLISLVLVAITYVVAFIVFWLLQWLQPYLNRMMERLAESPLRETLEALQEVPEPEPQAVADAAALPDSYRWLGLTVLLVGLAIAFYLALRRLRAAAREADEEARDSIFSSELLSDQAGNLLQNVLNRLRGVARANPFLPLDGEPDSRRAIRAVYQALLAGASQRGHPRRPSHTPVEYGSRLSREKALGEDDLATITSGYLAARYAPDAPSRAEAERVEAAWLRLQADWSAQDEASTP